MMQRRRESGWRATAFAAALFAITLNFLQPLAHAALMRDAAPSTLWSVFCNASSDKHQDAPLPATKHECCLGLAHAATLTAPTSGFTVLERTAAAVLPLPPTDQSTPAGIRDGPHRPRGPPSFV
jgi:hypothetical protein